jgi:hypothetical protein
VSESVELSYDVGGKRKTYTATVELMGDGDLELTLPSSPFEQDTNYTYMSPDAAMKLATALFNFAQRSLNEELVSE